MNSVNCPSMACASCTNCATSAVRSTKPRPAVCTVNKDDTTEFAETAESALREMDLDDVMHNLPVVPAHAGTTSDHRQILPLTSFCIRLAISTSRRQACS